LPEGELPEGQEKPPWGASGFAVLAMTGAVSVVFPSRGSFYVIGIVKIARFSSQILAGLNSFNHPKNMVC
jgi:hypothetical protein